MKTIISLIIILCNTIFVYSEDLDVTYLKKLKNVSEKRDKNTFQKEFLIFLNEVKSLSEKDKKKLYNLTVENLDLSSKDPFSDSDKWCLIGAVLLHTNDKDLIYNILKYSPPPRVGFVSLKDFLKNIPPEIVVKVISEGAQERSELQKK